MSECTESLLKLSLDFRDCRKSFIAIGDETRQQIIITLLESDYNFIENVNKIIQSMPHEEKPLFNGTDINTNL